MQRIRVVSETGLSSGVRVLDDKTQTPIPMTGLTGLRITAEAPVQPIRVELDLMLASVDIIGRPVLALDLYGQRKPIAYVMFQNGDVLFHDGHIEPSPAEDELERKLADARRMLADCAEQFEFYEQQHLAKPNGEGERKAKVNAEFAKRIRETLDPA